MPIDNFTTDKYVGQEEELLEYVTVVADKFHPDMEIQEDGSSALLPSQSPYQFMQRYNAGKLNVFFNYDNYMRNDNIDSIQAIIKALGIDPDKFWYLLLFISDYVSGKALNTWKFNDTSKEEIIKLERLHRSRPGPDRPPRHSAPVPRPDLLPDPAPHRPPVVQKPPVCLRQTGGTL